MSKEVKMNDYVKVKRTRFEESINDYIVEEISMQYGMFKKITEDEAYIASVNNKAVACPVRFELIEEKPEKPAKKEKE